MAKKLKIGQKSGGTMGKGCGLVFGLGWTAFSSIFVVVGLGLAWKSLKTRTWDEVPCSIERFELTADQAEDPPFGADLLFHYDFGGEAWSSDQLRLEWKGEDDYEDLVEIRAEILMGPEGPMEEAGGHESTCLVDPDDPSRAVLLASSGKEILFGTIFAIFGGGFVLIGIGLMTSAVRTGKSGRAKSSTEGEGLSGGILTAGFFGVFALAGLGMFGGLIVPKGLEYIRMKGWEETPAEVIWSRVRSHSGDDGKTYSVDIFYRYNYDQRSYRSNRYSLIGGSSSGSSGKQEIVRAHPAGSELIVHVNPAKPWQAVVERKLGWWALFALFPLPFMAVGLGGLWAGFRKKKKQAVSKSGLIRDTDEVSELRATGKGGDFGSSRGKRWLGFVGAVFLAAFWNGIVSVFLVQVWKGWAKGDPEWFLTLFMVPFVLIGVGLLLHVPYRLLAVFSPVYRLKLADERLKPGSRVSLDWRRSGGSGTPRCLSLWLVGMEEATYQRGTNTTTAKELFHEASLFETESPLMMQRGRCEVRVPEDAVPTFGKKNNKIRWYLRVVADVPWRPDVREDHEVKVRALHQEEIS